MVFNGVMGPVLLGAAVATFFNGSDFLVSKSNLTEAAIPVISHWGNEWHGLELWQILGISCWDWLSVFWLVF